MKTSNRTVISNFPQRRTRTGKYLLVFPSSALQNLSYNITDSKFVQWRNWKRHKTYRIIVSNMSYNCFQFSQTGGRELENIYFRLSAQQNHTNNSEDSKFKILAVEDFNMTQHLTSSFDFLIQTGENWKYLLLITFSYIRPTIALFILRI